MSAFSQSGIIKYYQTKTANGGATEILTESSPWWTIFIGNGLGSISLPDATTLKETKSFYLSSRVSNPVATITVYTKNGFVLTQIKPMQDVVVTLLDNTFVDGSWAIENGTDINEPFLLTPSFPTVDSKLNIISGALTKLDGSAILSDGNVSGSLPACFIDFMTGNVGASPITREGNTFTLPSVTTGQYVRVVFAYQKNKSYIDTAFSNPVASLSALDNIDMELLFNKTSGQKKGYIDLQAVAGGGFKSANALTNVIQNTNPIDFSPTIFNYTSQEKVEKGPNKARNSDFEEDNTVTAPAFWAVYGTGTSIAVVNDTTRLSGTKSLKLSQSATIPNSSNYVQGECFEFDLLDVLSEQFVSFDYRCLTTGADYGDFQVYIRDTTNNVDIPTQDVNVGSGVGQYKKVWLPNANSTTYAIRIYPKVASREIIIDNVVIGPELRLVGSSSSPFIQVSSGTVGSEDVHINGLNVLGSRFFVAKNNDYVKIRGAIMVNSYTFGDIELQLAADLAREVGKSAGDGTSTDNEIAGEATAYMAAGGVHCGSVIFQGSATNFVKIVGDDGAGNWNATNPTPWTLNDRIFVTLEYPLANADIATRLAKSKNDFIYNYSTTDATDLTAFATGMAGNAVPQVTTSAKTKRVRFPTPYVTMDKVGIELNPPGSQLWIDSYSVFPRMQVGGINYGIWVQGVAGSSTDLDVVWGEGGGAPSLSWPTLYALGWSWRARRPNFVGLGELMPATRYNDGYMLSSTQDLAGQKTWWTTGGTRLLDWRDDGTIHFYVPMFTSSTMNNDQGLVPLGGVVPIMSQYAGSFSLPISGAISSQGWMRCDGSLVPSGQGSPLEGQVLPDLTSSRFILGTSGSGLGSAPNDNPLAGAVGGVNSISTSSNTISWVSATVNCAFTQPTLSSIAASFDRTDFNTNQTAHTHTLGTHTHSVSHSHSIMHVHEFAIWKYAPGSAFSLQLQAPESYNWAQTDIISPVDVMQNQSITNGSNNAALLLDMGTLVDQHFYTSGVIGENGAGGAARTAVEPVVTGAASGSVSTEVASFTGTQTVSISGSITGGAASFNKSVMNSDQTSHAHTISDTRPSFVAAVYIIRVR